MCQLIETIKILDGKIYYLEYHQRRLEYTFKNYFGIQTKYFLNEIITIPYEFKNGLVKLRFLYSENNYKLDFFHYKQPKIETLKVVKDNDIKYNFKFVNRSNLNELIKQKNNCDDILIVKNQLITDTSIANIIFNYKGQLITPASPLLNGTCRQRLIDNGKINKAEIEITDIKKFKNFSLINAMFGEKLISYPITNIQFEFGF